MKSSNQYVIREFVFITIIAEGLYTYQQVNVYLKSIQRFIYLVRPREFFFFFFFFSDFTAAQSLLIQGNYFFPSRLAS